MAQPVLRGERLVLVPLAEEHLEWEVELDADPEVMRYLEPRARTRAQVERQHALRLAAAERVDGLGFWAGLVDDAYVGWWILEPELDGGPRPVAGSAELGYRLFRRWWRHGLASEGSRLLLAHGFHTVGLARVYGQTMAVNAGSRAVMERVGLRYVRTFHPSFDEPVDGQEHGEVEYALTRAEWLAALG